MQLVRLFIIITIICYLLLIYIYIYLLYVYNLDITYKDFFLPPTKTKKQVKFTGKNTYNDDQNMDDQSENEFMDDNEIEEEGDDDDDQPVKTKGLFDDEDEGEEEGESKKTAHQRQLERVQAQIEQFEQENLEGRHWTLKGEASAKARPVNSLLEEDLEFDHSVKPVPVITQETTNELEEMIKKRIADVSYYYCYYYQYNYINYFYYIYIYIFIRTILMMLNAKRILHYDLSYHQNV